MTDTVAQPGHRPPSTVHDTHLAHGGPKTSPSPHHQDAHAQHQAARQAVLTKGPADQTAAGANDNWFAPSPDVTLPTTPAQGGWISTTAMHDIEHLAEERLAHHRSNVEKAATRFLAEKDTLMEAFHVKFAPEDSFEWGNLIFKALDLAAAIFLGPEAGGTGEVVKAGWEKFAKAKETAEAAIPKHEQQPDHEGEVREARIELAVFAKHLVDTLLETTTEAINAASEKIPAALAEYELHIRPVANYDEPSGWAVACDGIGITDPIKNDVSEGLYMHMSTQFAGAVAALQVETQLEAPKLREQIKLIKTYEDFVEKHGWEALHEGEGAKLWARVTSSGVYDSGEPSRLDPMSLEQIMKQLEAKLAGIEAQAAQASSKAQNDVVLQETNDRGHGAPHSG
jgi:hypothetical protein